MGPDPGQPSGPQSHRTARSGQALDHGPGDPKGKGDKLAGTGHELPSKGHKLRSKDDIKKAAVIPQQVKGTLATIYGDALEQSIATGKNVPMKEVRARYPEVRESYPHLTAQQIRDTLWTMASQARRVMAHDSSHL